MEHGSRGDVLSTLSRLHEGAFPASRPLSRAKGLEGVFGIWYMRLHNATVHGMFSAFCAWYSLDHV